VQQELSLEKRLATASRIQATLATDDHAPMIAAFYREAWGDEATAESVLAARHEAAAQNVAAPGEAPPTALVLEGTRVIGYCSSIPQRLWDGATEHPAYWVKGLMVLPEYRNGPIGFLVVQQLAAQLPRSTALAVARAARRLFSALGYTDLGAVANFVRPLRPASLASRLDFGQLGLEGLPRWVTAAVRVTQGTGLARLAGGVVGIALEAASALQRRGANRFIAGPTHEALPQGELDDLWRRARRGLAASSVRDGVHFRGRFGDTLTERANNPYECVTVREAARLMGVAALRRPRATSDPRLRGIRVASISDIVFPPELADVGLALLGAVEQAARAAGADAILCTTSHRALTPLLRRRAYLRVPGNVHFFLRAAPGGERWPLDLASWWLARGDGKSDEVF